MGKRWTRKLGLQCRAQDDEDSQLTLRKMLFEEAGFEFLGVQSGTEALKLFRARDVGVVVLDYWMSGMKGTGIAVEMK